MTPARPPLATGAVDRDAETRMSPDALASAWHEPGARLLRMRGAEVPVIGEAGEFRLALVQTSGEYSATADGAAAEEISAVGDVYLGRVAGAPVFAAWIEPAQTDHEAGQPGAAGERWSHPFEIAGQLDDAERELIAIASALFSWHRAARFSPRDGTETRPIHGGWARLDAEGGELFPRTDPAVIVLIEHEDRILLGSNALWETGRFSLLAGFVEAGESLEQAVLREVYEESGVRLADVEYVTSQPWPFPRSLMLGYRARLADGVDPSALVPEPEEISELRWFSREELRDPGPGITLPRGLSIARWMIDRWIAEELPGAH